MLVIRLARTGKRHQAYFRIVVADKRRAVGSKFVEILGNYDPHAKKISLNTDKLKEYMKNGAVPSNTVAKLLKSEKIEMPKWVHITEKKKESKVKEEKAEKKEAPKKEDAEKPAEEASAEEPKEASEAPKVGEEDKLDNNPQVEEAKPEGVAKEGE